MPTINSMEKNGHKAHIITPEPGEKVMLCRCYKSSKFPLCDFTHQKIEGDVGPVIVEAPKATEAVKPPAG